MQSGPNRIVGALLHWLTPFILLFALLPAGCGQGYDPPESQYLPSGQGGVGPIGQDIELDGLWQILSISKDAVSIDMADSGLDAVLEIFADEKSGAFKMRWHVKEDDQHYYYCSADDMDIELDQQVEDQVILTYYHALIDPTTGQIIQNDGYRDLYYTAVEQGDGLIELQNGHPPQGIVMLPELDLLDEQDIISLTMEKSDVDVLASSPTQTRAQLCEIKSEIVNQPDPLIDDQPPVITRFELLSLTPTTDSFIEFDLQGEDNNAVSAWLVNESGATPAVDEAAWSDTRPQDHRLSSGYGLKTVYAWAKDASGNISEPALINVEYNRPLDTQPPVITRFELLSSPQTTNPLIEFDLQGEDNDAVSAWLVNESEAAPAVDDAAWSDTRPQDHILSTGYGMKTVYAWAKDAGGNISEPASINVGFYRPCVYLSTTVLPALHTTSNTDDASPSDNRTELLYHDDGELLRMDIADDDDPMYLMVDFNVEHADVRDFSVSVSSVTVQSDLNLFEESIFRRQIYAYNFNTEGWDHVGGAVNIGRYEARSDVSFTENRGNIDDYFGPDGDRSRFTLRIALEPESEISFYSQHDTDLVQLTVTHPEDPNCIDE
jgi:hypothetical protein